MHRRLLLLVFLLTTPLLSFLPLPGHVVYMPFVYRQAASESACQGQIVGTVYEDVDGNGRRDDNEVGLPGITVTLRPLAGADVATAITDEQGHYLLVARAGRYELRAEKPRGYRWTTPGAWGVDLVCATIRLHFGLQPIAAPAGRSETPGRGPPQALPHGHRRPAPTGSMLSGLRS